MEPLRYKLLFPAAIAIVAIALPAAAAAESIVPPENSAATQYTEAIPTGGGQKNASQAGNGKKRSPSAVLGSKKAKKLETQGPQGHAAAQVAAETAPPVMYATSEAASEPPPTPSTAASTPHPTSSHDEAGSRTGRAMRDGAPHESPAAVTRPPSLDTSGGSSGFDEVLGQATGASSNGELGLWLPLLVLAALIWALLYGLRRKRRGA
jgi:hypothetical protein